MRGRELLLANLVALASGLGLYFAFRPPAVWPLVALVLAASIVIQLADRQRVPGRDERGVGYRVVTLALNSLYGSFFAALAYFMILAATREIGYPYR